MSTHKPRSEIYIVLDAPDSFLSGDRLEPILDLELTTCCQQRINPEKPLSQKSLAELQILCNFVQSRDVAFIVENDLALAKTIGADGVHISQINESQISQIEHCHTMLKPDPIVGTVSDGSRHQSMLVGEAPASYLGFKKSYETPNSDDFELLKWWSEAFVVPSVAFDVIEDNDLALALTSGADFVSFVLSEDVNFTEKIEWAHYMAEKIDDFFNS